MYRSIAKNKPSVTDSILSKYPDLVNSVLTKDSKMTPLLKAIVHNNMLIIEVIMRHGGNPEIPNSKGITPFMLCAIRNNIDLAKYFVEKHQINLNTECH